jgi:hypothetical protein
MYPITYGILAVPYCNNIKKADAVYANPFKPFVIVAEVNKNITC